MSDNKSPRRSILGPLDLERSQLPDDFFESGPKTGWLAWAGTEQLVAKFINNSDPCTFGLLYNHATKGGSQ